MMLNQIQMIAVLLIQSAGFAAPEYTLLALPDRP